MFSTRPKYQCLNRCTVTCHSLATLRVPYAVLYDTDSNILNQSKKVSHRYSDQSKIFEWLTEIRGVKTLQGCKTNITSVLMHLKSRSIDCLQVKPFTAMWKIWVKLTFKPLHVILTTSSFASQYNSWEDHPTLPDCPLNWCIYDGNLKALSPQSFCSILWAMNSLHPAMFLKEGLNAMNVRYWLIWLVGRRLGV